MIPFRSILVAADFSAASVQAFHLACTLAGEAATRVSVLHVLEPRFIPEEPVFHNQASVRFVPVPHDPSEHRSATERLRAVYVPETGLDVTYRTGEGNAAAEILGVAEELGCDLIVMRTHGRKGLSRLVEGSVAETVLRNAHCAVLALRSDDQHAVTPARLEVIVHPTDFSENSEPALAIARWLAREQGARLVLVHVTPIEAFAAEAAGLNIDPGIDRELLEKLRARIDGPDRKDPTEVRLAEGNAAAEILREAREAGCGMIVMGTHGRSGLGRLLMGSVAENVLRGASCPVLFVKPAPGSKPSEASSSPGQQATIPTPAH